MALGHGDLLRRKIALAASFVRDSSARFWDHERLVVLFPKFLLTIHGSVRATVPLMNDAAAQLRQHPTDDPLRAPLIDYFERHSDEESTHEEWLIRDLEALGVTRDSVMARVASPLVASLIGAQYYWIRYAHPIALLGLFAVLEGHPPTERHLESVQRRTGLPAEAFRMLRMHAELDHAHADELFQLINTLPLAGSQVSLLGVSAFHTLDVLRALFSELVAQADAVDESAARSARRP